MEKQLKEEWIEALTSGEYRQGRNALCRWRHTRDGFENCCLGVLADIAADAEWARLKQSPDADAAHGVVYYIPGVSGVGALSYDFIDRIGLSSSAADVLAQMNDRGTSFAVIAKWIEDNVPVEGGDR